MAAKELAEEPSSYSKVNFEYYINPNVTDNPFLEYLKDEHLDYVLEFYQIKNSNAIKFVLENQPENLQRLLKALHKQFFKTSEHKSNFSNLKGFPQDVLEDIIEAARKRQYTLEMYDEAFAYAEDFLRNRCFVNFTKTCGFIDSLANLDLSDSAAQDDQEIEKAEAVPTLLPNVQPVLERIPEDQVIPSQGNHVKDIQREEKAHPPPNQLAQHYQRETLNLHPDMINSNDEILEEQRRLFKEFEELRKREVRTLQYHEQFDHRRSNGTASQNRTLPRYRSNLPTTHYSLDEKMPNMNPRQESAPYHATSSTLNHVSRLPSAFHSIATDTSSAFSATSDQNLRQQKQQHRAERRQMKSSAATNGNAGQLAGPLKHGQMRDPKGDETLAQKDPHEFFRRLEEKLNVHLKQQQFREYLKRSGMDRASNPSESVACGDVEGENESILDDHLASHQSFQQDDLVEEPPVHHMSTLRSQRSAGPKHRDRSCEGQSAYSYQGSSFQQQRSYAFSSHALPTQNYAYNYNYNQSRTNMVSAPSNQETNLTLEQQKEQYLASRARYEQQAKKDKEAFERQRKSEEKARKEASERLHQRQPINPPLPPRNSGFHNHQAYSGSSQNINTLGRDHPSWTNYGQASYNYRKAPQATNSMPRDKYAGFDYNTNMTNTVNAMLTWENDSKRMILPIVPDCNGQEVTMKRFKESLPEYLLCTHRFQFLTNIGSGQMRYFEEHNESARLPFVSGEIKVKLIARNIK